LPKNICFWTGANKFRQLAKNVGISGRVIVFGMAYDEVAL
jgi:hypothetical protein